MKTTGGMKERKDNSGTDHAQLNYEPAPRKYPRAPDLGRWWWLALLILIVLVASFCLTFEMPVPS